jgi:hypothetical protein
LTEISEWDDRLLTEQLYDAYRTDDRSGTRPKASGIPANRVERTRTNLSVGHAMKQMSEAHFAILRRHMVEVRKARY